MKPASPIQKQKPNAFWVPILLAVILGLLFWKSFLPGYVHFSNDSPLSQQTAAWLKVSKSVTGFWDDLNSIGFQRRRIPAEH